MTGLYFEFSSLDRYKQYITTSAVSVASLVDCRGKARSVRRTKQASHRSVLDGLRTSLTGAQQFLAEVAGEKGFPLG